MKIFLFFSIFLIFTILFVQSDLDAECRKIYKKKMKDVVQDFRHTNTYHNLLDNYRRKLIEDSMLLFITLTYDAQDYINNLTLIEHSANANNDKNLDSIELAYDTYMGNSDYLNEAIMFTHNLILTKVEDMIGMIDPENDRSYTEANSSTALPYPTSKYPMSDATYSTKPIRTTTKKPNTGEGGGTTQVVEGGESGVSSEEEDKKQSSECRTQGNCNEKNRIAEKETTTKPATKVDAITEAGKVAAPNAELNDEKSNSGDTSEYDPKENHVSEKSKATVLQIIETTTVKKTTGDWRSRFKVMMNKILRRNLEAQKYPFV